MVSAVRPPGGFVGHLRCFPLSRRPVQAPSSLFSFCLARICFLAAALSAVRVVAASNSRSASRVPWSDIPGPCWGGIAPLPFRTMPLPQRHDAGFLPHRGKIEHGALFPMACIGTGGSSGWSSAASPASTGRRRYGCCRHSCARRAPPRRAPSRPRRPPRRRCPRNEYRRPVSSTAIAPALPSPSFCFPSHAAGRGRRPIKRWRAANDSDAVLTKRPPR
jgi:hypothetical protein